MSRFHVLVLGDDPDALMDTYDQNLEVDPHDGYEINVSGLRKGPMETASDEAIVSRYIGREGEGWRLREDGVYVEISCDNPNGQWDYYTPVELCTDAMLPLKPGVGFDDWDELADRARKKDIDLEAMFSSARRGATETVAAFNRVVAERGPMPNADWVNHSRSDPTWSGQKDAWWKSPWLVAAKSEPLLCHPDFELDDLVLLSADADAYIEQCVSAAIPGYAFLDGAHGWLDPFHGLPVAIGSDSLTGRALFYETRMAIVLAAPDDTLLSVFECHA